MKIEEDITTIFSHQVRSGWHVIQNMICLVVCLLASSSRFPYHERANNLFVFFTIITGVIFIYKICRTDLYTNSVRLLGAWGARYRCLYAVYYPIMAFLCASMGGFKGYSFALIWILSGGTFLVVADKIAKEEKAKKQEVADMIEKKYKHMENGCPFCHSRDYEEGDSKDVKNQRKSINTCNNKECGKTWTSVYELVDLEVKDKDIPLNMELAKKVFL